MTFLLLLAIILCVCVRRCLPTTNTEQGAVPKNFFMVFEYLEYDLTGILDTPEIRLTQDHIKSWSKQLLDGCNYMHKNMIIHRDLKCSNILVNRMGELKIADWGLARSWNSEMERLTNNVITLCYRPPELLLGCIDYTTKIDMWSVGCILAELFRRSAFLKGSNEATQIELIFRTCGHPTTENWPDINKQCRLWKRFKPDDSSAHRMPNRLVEKLRERLPHPQWMTDKAVKLIYNLLELNPETRWSAEQAIGAYYFFENPMVKPAKDLPMRFAVTSCHEMDCRRRHEQKMALKRNAAAAAAAKNGKHNPPPPPPKL
jgi:serine/threonine protein kinase